MLSRPSITVALLSVCTIPVGGQASERGRDPRAELHLREASDSPPEGLTAGDWGGIRAAHEAARHAAQADVGGYRARNPGQQWVTRFDGRGFTTTPDASGWTWGLELVSYGFPGAERAVEGEARGRAEGARVAYAWDATLEEWYVNDRRGLEHGYTVRERPERAAGKGGPLTITLAVRGGLQPEVSEDGRGASFRDESGASVLTYTGLTVLDAGGSSLPARIEHRGAGLKLVIDERGALYPLTIDPIAQQAYLKASNTGAGDQFGISVAISGDTVVVGADREASNATGVNGDQSNNSASFAGAAYVFVRSGTTWSQQAYLKASNTQSNDSFGRSVAISGDTVVIGAAGEDSASANNQADNSFPSSGAAYVFVRDGTTWTQEAYLKSSNIGGSDIFGSAVAVSGDTIVVAAEDEDSNATGVNGSGHNDLAGNSGAVYVFVRSGPTTWTQQAYLKASNTASNDVFGKSVSVWDDTVVVGALGEDSSATGVNGNQSDNGGADSGAVYVFVRSGTTWTQQAYVKASNTGGQDEFGYSVSLADDTLVVGAPGEDSHATGVNGNQTSNAFAQAGAAYVFVRSGTTWSQEAYLKASNTGGNDQFGHSVSVSGSTVVVGAHQEDSDATGVNGDGANDNATFSGAVYAFTRNGTAWTQEAYLKASNTETSDRFGQSVSVSDYTVVVGANFEGSNATGVNGNESDNSAGASGAVYAIAFTTGWTGATDSDWTDASNWADGVPNPTKAAIIPDAATTPNDPVISVSAQTCNTLFVESGGTLDVSAGTDSLGAYGGALVHGPVTGTGELVFEAAGTLQGTSTISTTLGVRAEYDLALAGSPEITGDLTANADVLVRDGADADVGGSMTVLRDLALDGSLSVGDSLDVDGGLIESVAGEAGGGNLHVGGSGDCVEVGSVDFGGFSVSACGLRVENDSSSQELVFDLDNGWPNDVTIAVAGTITILTQDLSIGGDLTLEQGTLAIGAGVETLTVSGDVRIDQGTLSLGADIALDADALIVELGALLELIGRQLFLPAPVPVIVRGTLSIGAAGELLLESNTVTVESGGTLRLAGGSALARLSGFGTERYTLDLQAGSTLAANNFAFTQMSASGIVIANGVTIAPSPLNLRSGVFDRPANGGVLLDVSRTVPTEFRFLRFENSGGAVGANNVRVPASSATITMAYWSGAFGGPAFEDDPGAKLVWAAQLGDGVVASPKLGATAPSVPTFPIVVGNGGGFADVGAALASLAGVHAGERVTFELAPGAHEPFTLSGDALAFDLRLVARPGATIDASLAPLRILGLEAERSVELVGLALDARGSSNPALVIGDSDGVVLLAGLAVVGGAHAPAVLLSNARAVALQDGAIEGAPGLALEHGSRASASGVRLETSTLAGRSWLATRGSAGRAFVEPGSSWIERAAGPRLAVSSTSPGTVKLEGTPGTAAWLLAAPRLGFEPLAPGVLLLERSTLRLLGPPRSATLQEWSLGQRRSIDPDYVQAIVIDPVFGFGLSDILSIESKR